MLSYLLDNPIEPSTIFGLAIVVLGIGFLVVMWVISSKKRKQQEQESKDLIDAVKPGNKVKTIGGVCGIVVEVNDEENTFVLETGSETAGKSYVKFDKQAIYQTDAVVEKQAPAAIGDEVAPVEETVPESKPEETENTAQTAETPEKSDEGPALIKPKKDKKAKAQTEENND